jgi:hypothetical protein
LGTGLFAGWVTDFEAAAEQRRDAGDPDWARGAKLDAAIVRSLQRFQLGESGDGANLAAKASLGGDESYARAVRLFIAEEQDHARLLAALLAAVNAPLISSHWSDAVFVRLRRALGLRLELMVLFVAEFIALSYYRALRDGARDPLTAEVAGRILADEERHVRFHSGQLRLEFAMLAPWARLPVSWAWQLLMTGTACVVVLDHGTALRRLGVPRRRFTARVLAGFAAAVTSIRRAETSPALQRAGEPAHAAHPAPQNAIGNGTTQTPCWPASLQASSTAQPPTNPAPSTQQAPSSRAEGAALDRFERGGCSCQPGCTRRMRQPPLPAS